MTNIKELRKVVEPGFDNREAALSLLESKDPLVKLHGLPKKIRSKPCKDCAVIGGLYTGIAACGYQYLDEQERNILASSWTCHNGGRCEGASMVLCE